jgi:hypothetical protein
MFLHRFKLQLKVYILTLVRFQIFLTSQILGLWLSIIFTLNRFIAYLELLESQINLHVLLQNTRAARV